MTYLRESFLIRSLRNFQHRISERETKKKYYFRDHGLLSLFLHEPSSLALETVIFNHLASIYQNNIYYLRDTLEVDFFIPDKQLIQVRYNLNNIDTREREIRSLIRAAKIYKTEEITIITLDEEDIINVDDMRISVVPAWKWMLV